MSNNVNKNVEPDLTKFTTYDLSTAESWKPSEVGDYVIGTVARKKEISVKGRNGEELRRLLILSTPTGQKAVWISAILEDFYSDVSEGDSAYIQYTGKKELEGGQSMNTFNVKVQHGTP